MSGHSIRYVVATMSYGALSKLYTVHNATVQRNFTKNPIEKHDDDVKLDVRQVPMLLRDKVFLIGLNACSAVYFWPIYAYCDLGKLELMARGEYRKPEYAHMIDYIFPC